MEKTKGEGSVYEKVGTYKETSSGKEISYKYFQAVKDVPKEFLPLGVARKRITGNGATKKEAIKRREANYAEWLAKWAGKVPPSPKKRRHKGQLTLDEWFSIWVGKRENSNLSDTMKLKYSATYGYHISPYVGKIYLNELHADHLKVLFFQTLTSARVVKDRKTGKERKVKLQSAARRNCYRLLSIILNDAVGSDRLLKSPLKDVDEPEVVRPNEDVTHNAELAKGLIETLENENHPDYCRYLLQFMGLRRAERLGLSWSNVDLFSKEPKMIVANQLARYETNNRDGDKGWYIKGWTKNYNPREILLAEPFLSALRNHRKQWEKLEKQWEKNRDKYELELKAWKKNGSPKNMAPIKNFPEEQFQDLVFLLPNGAPITLNRDNEGWHQLLKENNLPYWRAHLNRHITATLLAEQDPPPSMPVAQSILGHETEAMLYYYTRTTTKQQHKPLTAYGLSLMPNKKKTTKTRKTTKKKPN